MLSVSMRLQSASRSCGGGYTPSASAACYGYLRPLSSIISSESTSSRGHRYAQESNDDKMPPAILTRESGGGKQRRE